MTSERREPAALKPFLLRFSEELPPQNPVRMKYDPVRQVSLVEVGGQWVEASAENVVAGATYMTKVQAETTDDN